jgi:hypothetical protein
MANFALSNYEQESFHSLDGCYFITPEWLSSG